MDEEIMVASSLLDDGSFNHKIMVASPLVGDDCLNRRGGES